MHFYTILYHIHQISKENMLCIWIHKTSIHQKCSAKMIWRFEAWWFESVKWKGHVAWRVTVKFYEIVFQKMSFKIHVIIFF